MRYLFLFVSLILLTSCTVYGVTNDYKKLSGEEKNKIVPLKDFSTVDNTKIYKINGQQLKTELAKHPKSLVYIFTNGCTSQYCLPMSNYEKFAKENNYKLFLVMEGYAKLDKTTEQRSEVFQEPLYSIDNDSYNSWYSIRYHRLFANELRGIERKSKPDWEGSLYFFNYDKLEKVTSELPQ
ncbi:hypothetical protein NZ698_09210 [Chryseobacterium sp. PBS4-4]|uniref:Thioredoxin domain-containing protein n=1 Tax=Chryseobacterium edaphi TaxID=2976532 RepID=A0ABT2W9P5_9FLAO|nr:hypothetical protein [Chryseobacterium edaphi]MCU7617375.1 hypothetical protein [Chryseobacterium edaphi]